MNNLARIRALEQDGVLEQGDWVELLESWDDELREAARERAQAIARERFGTGIYLRGLIEFTNHCKNDCYYCGIRRGNGELDRYRLDREQILRCCETGYGLGFRTFVLQGGEDPWYDKRMTGIVTAVRERFPDCAITLSVGERDAATFREWREAGADRYLLRHETAADGHYRLLHPPGMSLAVRKDCLYQLRELGYQVGCGFMVGSPGQTARTLAEDMAFIRELEPQMVGIGPFLPHSDTPFRGERPGSMELTLLLLSLLRIMLPDLLLPATTALGTIHPQGRELGILAGANVVMPNLSPVGVRESYQLYDNKICTGEESAECRGCLERRLESIGYHIAAGRGDWRPAHKVHGEERVNHAV